MLFTRAKQDTPTADNISQAGPNQSDAANPIMLALGETANLIQNSPQLAALADSFGASPFLAALERVDIVAAKKRVQQLQAKYPKDSPAEIAHRIMTEKALFVGGSGFASSILPGIAAATFALDLAASTMIQAEMVLQIAGAYGMELESKERQGEALTIFGLALGGGIALKAGLGFARNIPLVGGVIGASSNAAMLYAVGAAACKYYEQKSQGIAVSEQLLMESHQAATKSLTTNLPQVAIMDEVLLHVLRAGQPNKDISELKIDLSTLPISPEALSRLQEELESFTPLNDLLAKVDEEFAVVLIAQCDQVIHADDIVTLEEEQLLQQISGYLTKKFQLGSEELVNQVLSKDFNANVRVCGFSPNGKFLVAGSEDKSLRIWRSFDSGFTYIPMHQIQKAHEDAVQALAFHPSKNIFITGGNDRGLAYWDLSTGQLIRRVESGHANGIFALSVRHDGLMASGSWDKTIKIWNLDKGRVYRSLEGHTAQIWCLAFNPVRNLLASGANDNTARLWNPETGELVQELKGHQNGIYSIAFSPDGKTLATGSWDRTIRLWDVETGAEIAVLQGHEAAVWQVKFTADQRYLVSSCDDKTIRVWDLNTYSLRLRLDGHEQGVYSLDISPLHSLLASGSWDQSVRLWAVDLD